MRGPVHVDCVVKRLTAACAWTCTRGLCGKEANSSVCVNTATSECCVGHAARRGEEASGGQ